MDSKKEIIKNSIYLSFLVILGEFLIYFKKELTSFIPNTPEWFVPFLALITAIAIGWFFGKAILKNNRKRDQFIEIATHKFRTPISVIEWSADSLETEIDITQRREEVLKIRNSLEKLKEIIDTLMGVIEAKDLVFYHFDPVNFREILEGVLKENLRKEMKRKNINFNMNIPNNLPLIYADNRRISFVLKNLIENAVTYSKEGGNITIEVENRPETMLFSIKDGGIGISENDLPNIFSSFYRTKEAKLSDTEGMGLGLYVSRKIMEKHGGSIWAESQGKGKGATFYVEFKLDKYRQVL